VVSRTPLKKYFEKKPPFCVSSLFNAHTSHHRGTTSAHKARPTHPSRAAEPQHSPHRSHHKETRQRLREGRHQGLRQRQRRRRVGR
jgi:hypothetical protein